MANPNAVTPKPTAAEPATKPEGKRYNLKLKGADGKWASLGTLFMREGGTGGVATLYADVKALFQEGVQKLENVAVFINDRPAKARG